MTYEIASHIVPIFIKYLLVNYLLFHFLNSHLCEALLTHTLKCLLLIEILSEIIVDALVVIRNIRAVSCTLCLVILVIISIKLQNITARALTLIYPSDLIQISLIQLAYILCIKFYIRFTLDNPT